MNGYCVKYVDPFGVIDVTWFGELASSFPNVDDVQIVRVMFSQAHCGCRILDLFACRLSDFRKIARQYE